MLVLLYVALARCASHGNPGIKHVVQLMFENRAFDTILGYVDHNPEIDNLVGKEPFCNYLNVTNPHEGTVCTAAMLNVKANYSPDHRMSKILEEIYGVKRPEDISLDLAAPMNGFAQVARTSSMLKFKNNLTQIAQIMAGFHPSSIPIHRALAENYLVADRWFASVPGPTIPNRLFAHATTSGGMFYNDLLKMAMGLPQRTIFQDIMDSGLKWKSYYQEVPSIVTHRHIRRQMFSRTKHMNRFYKAAQTGKLANYTFIEPYYGEVVPVASWVNDGHAIPGSSFNNAELLLKKVYEALRNGPEWNSTLLIVTYDEHGGYHDHVSPPVHVPNPDGINVPNVDKQGYAFNFDRLGVRVPAILISPWLAKGGGMFYVIQ